MWTPELTERVRSLYLAGRSYAQIARATGLTRNQVAGKLSRMGVTERTGPRASLEDKPRPVRLRGSWEDRLFEPYEAFRQRKIRERNETRKL